MSLDLPILPSQLDPTTIEGKVRDALDEVDKKPAQLAALLRGDPRGQLILTTMMSQWKGDLTPLFTAADALGQNAMAVLSAVPGIGPILNTLGSGILNSSAGRVLQKNLDDVVGEWTRLGGVVDKAIGFSGAGLLVLFAVEAVQQLFSGSRTPSQWYSLGMVIPDLRAIGLDVISTEWDRQPPFRRIDPGDPLPTGWLQFQLTGAAPATVPSGWLYLAPEEVAWNLRAVLVTPSAGDVFFPAIASVPWLQMRWNAPPLTPARFIRDGNPARKDKNNVPEGTGQRLPQTLLSPMSVYRLYPSPNPAVDFIPFTLVPPQGKR